VNSAYRLARQNKTKTMSTYLNKFYNQEVLPFLKNIAWACNLKYHEDLRTFLIVGVVYASEYWRWNLYDHPQYPEFSQSIWFRLFDIFWLMMTCTHAFYCATIVHNCVHFAQFRNYHVNTVWHLVLGHTYGWPVYFEFLRRIFFFEVCIDF